MLYLYKCVCIKLGAVELSAPGKSGKGDNQFLVAFANSCLYCKIGQNVISEMDADQRTPIFRSLSPL